MYEDGNDQDDDLRESEYRTYRWISNAFVVLILLAITGAIGLALGLAMARPWYEGAAFGVAVGVAFVGVQRSNGEFMEYWENETRKDFKKSQRALDEAWKREQERPDDEYVGW